MTWQVAPRLEGAEIKLGTETLTAPPLSFKQLKQFGPKLASIGKIAVDMSAEAFDTVVDVVHAALSRNYPEIPREFVEDYLDMGNVQTTMAAVMGQSGLKATEGNETAGS